MSQEGEFIEKLSSLSLINMYRSVYKLKQAEICIQSNGNMILEITYSTWRRVHSSLARTCKDGRRHSL